MKLTLSLILTSLAILPVHAQEKTADHAERQIPTNQKGVENAADTAVRATKPLSPEAAKRLEKIRSLHAKQSDFRKGIASGKVIPFPDVQANWQKHLAEAIRLSKLSKSIPDEKDPARRRELQRALSLAIQPIGWLMEDADFVPGYANVLSAAQSAELLRLEAAFEASQGRNEGNASIAITPASRYTFTHLPVEITVVSAPDIKVLLKAPNGGLFSNDLGLIELTTDANGIATTEWITRGDAIAGCHIEARSNHSNATPTAAIEVVKPVLSPPFNLPETKAAAKAAAKAAEAHTK